MVRADARENRAKILAAAKSAFLTGGEASMNQIAQQAGVGAGTLYRNYPSRESLVLAVYADEVERLVDSVGGLLGEHPPIEALRLWTTDLVTAMRAKHGLGDALSVSAHQLVAEQSYGPVLSAIDQVFAAGRHDGTIRMDADPRDFLQLTGALWRAADGPEDRSQPMLGIILDGLKPPD